MISLIFWCSYPSLHSVVFCSQCLLYSSQAFKCNDVCSEKPGHLRNSPADYDSTKYRWEQGCDGIFQVVHDKLYLQFVLQVSAC